jgi:hypothetical protein
MKKLSLSVLLIVMGSGLLSLAEDKIPESLMTQFTSTDWPTVLSAKESIENLEAVGIPQLMNLLNETTFRKLKNTGDLIYPGTKKFYGHGQIVDHNIDEICIRAGWLLEDITFQNFGFAGIYLPENELDAYIKDIFPEYYNSTHNKQGFENMSISEKRKIIRNLSIKKAQSWWNQNSENWNRIDALLEALKSADEKCQAKALFYIRNGKTRCTGLTKAYYQANLEDIIKELSASKLKRISENAKLILMDMDYDWLVMKASSKG